MLLVNGQQQTGMSLYHGHCQQYLAAKLSNLIVSAKAGIDLDKMLKAIDIPKTEFKLLRLRPFVITVLPLP